MRCDPLLFLSVLNIGDLQRDRLRIAFVVYGGMNRRDWREVTIDNVNWDTAELVDQLLSTLHVRTFRNYGSPAEFGAKLVEDCRKALSAVLPFTNTELKFLDLLLDKGKIDPALLTEDAAFQKRIRSQPLLEWKAINVRRFKGIG